MFMEECLAFEMVGHSASRPFSLCELHRSEWLEAHKEKMELIYLPSYSREFIPVAYLGNYLKQTITLEGPPRDKDSFNDEIWFRLTCLGDLANRISALFRHPAFTCDAP